MLKIFRNLRKGSLLGSKTGKYLAYALGEITLVVIGILIALQINNQNEDRKARLKEREILTKFVQDLRSDSISFQEDQQTLREINTLHRQLYEIGVLGKDSIKIDNPQYIRRLPYYNPISRENDPFIAGKISNYSIRDQILLYFRYMKDMDEAYAEFHFVMKDRMRVFLAEKAAHDLTSWFEHDRASYAETSQPGLYSIILEEELRKLSKTTEFQQLMFETDIRSMESFNSSTVLSQQNHQLIRNIEAFLEAD